MDDLLDYYNEELSAIYETADDFAHLYPKIAGRLRIGATGADDPHVERLIQAFAFLTARIQKQLDDDFPEIAQAMLEVLVPQQLAPIPSMTILELELDRSESQLAGGYELPRHTELVTESVGAESCAYRTAWPVHLWPIAIDTATLTPPPFGIPAGVDDSSALSMLKLQLSTFDSEMTFSEFDGLDSLRFFLNGQRQYIFDVYELLANNLASMYVTWKNGEQTEFRRLDPSQFAAIGFADGEEILPISPRVPRSLQLLREYFTFPQRFMFFELKNMNDFREECHSTQINLLFFLNRRIDHIERFVSRETFRLGCAPVVNLFELNCEPVRMTHEETEYRIVPDSRHAAAREIFTVESVELLSDDGASEPIAPLYSIQHADESDAGRRFWISNRRQARLRDGLPDPGTEVYLSVVDLDFQPQNESESVLNVGAVCLNRDLPDRLPYGGGSPEFQINLGGPVSRIKCLLQPTPTRRPALKEGVLWRLVAQLSLNHMQIYGGPEAARTLREYLKVHDAVRSSDDPFPFDGILSVSSRRVVSRVQPDSEIHSLDEGRSAEPGFARGLEVTIELDEQKFVGIGGFLFASILERFFALHCSINSFTATVLRTKQRKEIRRWPARTGEKRL